MSAATDRHFRHCIVAAALVSLWGCDRPQKPMRDSTGEFALYVDKSLTPAKFHEPLDNLDKWRARHAPVVKRGKRSRYQCVLCHDPERHCTQCHTYMGMHHEIYRAAAPTLTAAPQAKMPAAKRPAEPTHEPK